MAEIVRSFVSINCVDGVKRSCGNTFYVSNEDMLAYNVAGDAAARAATDVGILITRYMALNQLSLVSVNAGQEVVQDTYADPSDTVLRGNKLEFFRVAGGLRRAFEIPGRNPAAFTQGANSLEISLTTPAAMAAWVTAYNNTVLDLFENPCLLLSGKVVD